MKKIKVSKGIHWVEIPEAGLFILCGSPPDSVKHLMKRGLIRTEEKNGLSYETGPNAILLSDVSLQGERFCNVAEFPVLQMLYRQGMIIPNHPNNTGIKPLLIGIEDQVKAQANYIYRGNYGLMSKDEMIHTGIPRGLTKDIMRMKLRFAFDKIRRTEELIELRIVAEGPLELRNGALIQRKGNNLYEFTYGKESVIIDLNLAGNEEYEAPYYLGHHDIRREYFSVIHSGEGDGWDINRPCMGSILTFQGKIYLIDAGPNIIHGLRAIGISANDIEGVFHTHSHDDHFIGLPALFRSDHKIKYFTTPLVRKSIEKKLSALLSMEEGMLSNYFEIQDLEFDEWNDIDGLEVMPSLSPHPVETSVLFFRALWEGGYKTYAHLADIASLDVLRSMVTNESTKSGISQEYFDQVKKMYMTPVDIKKIDIGGGMIHGKAEDFIEDKSKKIILSHTALPLTDKQKEIGTNTTFGMADVLIPSDQDFTKASAFQYLQTYFPTVPRHELRMLLNCPIVSFNPGSFLLRKGRLNPDMFFILSGIIEFIMADAGVYNRLSTGSFVGEISGMTNGEVKGTYRAFSFVKALKIPCNLYIQILKRNKIYEDIKKILEIRQFFQRTWLFGDMISCPVKNKIARSVKSVTYGKGQNLPTAGSQDLFLVMDGQIEIYHGTHFIETQGRGGFFGEENILF
ncbi:MAG: cyclic nucleotide-binding domain-containing protein, partial [Pseudomonadota bacterium]